MLQDLNRIRIPDPKFLLLYSPLQFASGEIAKPDGSLGLAYVAGALRCAGYEAKILDCSVGDEQSSLNETFFRSVRMSNGLFRVGMSSNDILARISQFEVIGVSSIFTSQTTMVLDLIRFIKNAFPDKLVIAGGINARSLRSRFFDSGTDMIALSEAEETTVQIASAIQKGGNLTNVPGIAFRDQQGREVVNPTGRIISDLDELPIPAWDLLPLSKYWEISRPHGGQFPQGKRIAYASLQTSRGCPFGCQYCHNSEEGRGSVSGNIGRFRTKSISRVVEELKILKGLGVQYVFLEDDSMLANKRRAYELLGLIREMGLQLLNVNGINICHLYKRNHNSHEVDVQLLEALGAAGLSFLTLPFESASQRIIDKYSASKWNIKKTDTEKLFRALEETDLKTSGNYMIGYPDETADEIFNTILMAKHHVDQGLNYALFFMVVPFPGTALFNTVVQNGQLDPIFDPDEMRWTKSVMRNLALNAHTLERICQMAWLLVNSKDYVRYKREMFVNEAHE